MNLDQQLLELMLRAPAVPDWWKPDMTGFLEPSIDEQLLATFLWSPAPKEKLIEWRAAKSAVREWEREKAKRRVAQWPSAYARMVMEATKNGKGFSKWVIPEDKE